jgi:integrase
MGRDVVADYDASRRRQKSEHEIRAKSTFAAAARDFIEQYASKKTRRWRETARLLGLAYPLTGGEPTPIKGGLCERWSDKPIAEIDGHDIHSLVDETRRSGAPGLERRSDGPTEARARVMLSCLSKMFSWLVQHRRVSQNPCKDVHRPEASRARDRVLTDTEIVKFWRATEADPMEFSALLKLLLLTGCRLNEVAGMTRAELSDDGATWNIPGARTKNKRPHIVPLAPLARKMVGSGSEGFVFTTTGRSPVSGWSKIKRRLDEAMKIPPWRLHDLRRTAATGMAEIGIAPHIVEAALNHISGAKAGVAGTYNRAAYAPEKRAALERWASHVQGLVSERPANVVKMRKTTSVT